VTLFDHRLGGSQGCPIISLARNQMPIDVSFPCGGTRR
jgi:hypothetical protein